MKKVLAILLCCIFVFGSAFTVLAAYDDWDDYSYDDWDDDWDDEFTYGGTATQISAPDMKLGGKSRIFDKGLSSYEEYSVEFVVSGGAASVSDIIVYNAGSKGDVSEFASGVLPDITLERIKLVKEYNWLDEQEESSLIGKYPLKLGRNADGVGTGDVEYILGATGLNVTLQPGAYVIAVTPKEGSYFDPFGLSGWSPALSIFGKGNLDEFDVLTDSARIALIKSVEGGGAYQDSYDSASWASAAKEHEMLEKAAAEEKRKAAELASKPITLKVNGKVIPTDSPPVIENGRVLIPARAIVDALGGYYVKWDPAEQTVYVMFELFDEPKLAMTINSTTAYVHGTANDGTMAMLPVEMDVPAKIINGRTMVPARFVAENLNCDVSWDAASRTVVVEKD